jgi:arginyl-tRNA synthetase
MRLFSILGTAFDYIFFDSDTTDTGIREVRRSLAKGIFEESEGAIIYRGEKAGLFTLVFITSRGTPTYETKDIGLAFLKEIQAPTDEVIITTAVEQIGHFQVMLAALSEIAPHLAEKTQHVAHGLLQLTTGKMSSRKGNTITAAELIREVIELALTRNDDPVIAEQVAIAAIKYMILRSTPGSNIIFDPEKSLSLEGDSGPYLQYATVRAKSVIENARKENSSGEHTTSKNSTNKMETSESQTPFTLERLIIRFPDIVRESQKNRAPHTIAQYLLRLASEWNSFYAQERIVGSSDQARKVQIAEAFVITMQNGLHLLGISVPERM